jgi:alanine racemase
MTRPTRAIVDLDALASNFRLLRQRAGSSEVIPVVKADAYGHGAIRVVRRLAGEGALRFAVALFEEGAALRDAGVEEEILLLSSGDPADVAELAARRLIPTVFDPPQARALGEAAAKLSSALPVHLKLDTGMGRLGVRPDDLAAMIAVLKGARSLVLAGTFTQFASAEDGETGPAGAQMLAFDAALAALADAGLDPGLVHASNSAGILALAGARYDAVRPGIALYGIPPSPRLDDPALRPALRLETRVLSVKRVPPGTPLGYGGSFVTRRATTVASLPIGYHDGLRRAFSGRVAVLMRGGQAPIVGAVSMDLTLVDATDCGAVAGDRAVVLGREGNDAVDAWQLARAADTVPWEILCGIGERVRRVYTA